MPEYNNVNLGGQPINPDAIGERIRAASSRADDILNRLTNLNSRIVGSPPAAPQATATVPGPACLQAECDRLHNLLSTIEDISLSLSQSI